MENDAAHFIKIPVSYLDQWKVYNTNLNEIQLYNKLTRGVTK